MKTIKQIMFVAMLVMSKGLIAISAPENNQAFHQQKEPDEPNVENDPVLQSFNHPKKENESNFAWLKNKSEFLQENIDIAIKEGNFDELKKYQKSKIDEEFNSKENIEFDELIEVMSWSIKLQNGPRKLKLFKEFTDYCKKQEVPTESYFDEQNMDLIKRLSLIQFSKNDLEIFKMAFIINSTVSNELKEQFHQEKQRYCNPIYKKGFKKECDLCNEYEKIIKEFNKK